MSKLKRQPMLSYINADFYLQPNKQEHHPPNLNKMECGVTGASYTNGTTPGGGGGGGGILADVRSERSPAKTGLHVNFKDKGEIKEKREKFLTAKYGHHQMSLIRKRLAVEMWLYEEMKKLYECKSAKQVDPVNSDEVEVDIDELLDMDSDDERRRHLQNLLINAKGSQSDIKKFINELLDKAKTL
ncbi:protein phosphatase 1 regulatory subunit 14B isoform X2 [Diabrotica virgifera virgifera]|uniref:Protein phosphatase 1 regulatory subunit 14B n=1 Tax=Diabrotica virgifera virgifera TaxID=50390 RepID=A0ABM5IH72_DIAVI|nr:protein phosphatase 1 regulatory subunit 14B isoform X2 [Diabrotica virgifera virgifera]